MEKRELKRFYSCQKISLKDRAIFLSSIGKSCSFCSKELAMKKTITINIYRCYSCNYYINCHQDKITIERPQLGTSNKQYGGGIIDILFADLILRASYWHAFNPELDKQIEHFIENPYLSKALNRFDLNLRLINDIN